MRIGANAFFLRGAAAPLPAPPALGSPPRGPTPCPGGTGPCLLRPFLQGLELPEGFFHMCRREDAAGVWQLCF